VFIETGLLHAGNALI